MTLIEKEKSPWHEQYGVRICKNTDCKCNPDAHFHVSYGGGQSASIKGDEDSIRYFISNAHIHGYKDGRAKHG